LIRVYLQIYLPYNSDLIASGGGGSGGGGGDVGGALN